MSIGKLVDGAINGAVEATERFQTVNEELKQLKAKHGALKISHEQLLSNRSEIKKILPEDEIT